MIEARFALSLGTFSLSASFNDGGIILLSGENGSGKSTFLNALAGFIPITSGRISLNGRDITELEVQKRGIVHITPGSYIGNLTVERHIAWPKKEDSDPGRIQGLKESFGINFHGKVGNLSMGQRIRVSLATAFYREPAAVLIDEALSNLSSPLEAIGEIERYSRSFKTDVVIVAHALQGFHPEHHYVMENGNMRRQY